MTVSVAISGGRSFSIVLMQSVYDRARRIRLMSGIAAAAEARFGLDGVLMIAMPPFFGQFRDLDFIMSGKSTGDHPQIDDDLIDIARQVIPDDACFSLPRVSPNDVELPKVPRPGPQFFVVVRPANAKRFDSPFVQFVDEQDLKKFAEER